MAWPSLWRYCSTAGHPLFKTFISELLLQTLMWGLYRKCDLRTELVGLSIFTGAKCSSRTSEKSPFLFFFTGFLSLSSNSKAHWIWLWEPKFVSCGRSGGSAFWQIWCLQCLFLLPSFSLPSQGVVARCLWCFSAVFWYLPVMPVPGCWVAGACWNTLIWETSPVGHFFSVMNLVFPFLLKLGLLYESIQKICILGMFCSICLKLAGPVNIFANKSTERVKLCHVV